jgi:hypothetical protein
MATSFVTDAGTLLIPGAYPSIKVQTSNSGLASNGIIYLLGEADAGASFADESDLGANAYGPDQLAAVQAKYKTGNLVDAYRGAVAAANDDQIQGAFNRCILVKTNVSTRASAALSKYDSSQYSLVQDRSYGKLGNLISWQVTAKTAEVVPTTGSFTFLPPIAGTNISVRVNGGAATAITIAALATPATFAGQLDAVAGVDVAGGTDRTVLTGTTGTVALAVVSGNNVTITRSVAWNNLPSIGDTLYVPSGSVLATANAAAAGSYVVTAVTATVISATKLLDVTGAPSALTPPTAKTATALAAATDVQCFAPIQAHLVTSAAPLDGAGKTLEIAQLTSNTGILEYCAYTYDAVDGAEPATFMSKAATSAILNSSAEYKAKLTAARKFDAIIEDLADGGQVALKVGYKGTTASMVNDGATLTITVSGGAGTSPAEIPLKDYATIADLAAYIDSLTGFSAAPGTAVLGSQSPMTLDQGTFTFCTTFGGYAGRIKQDAYRFFTTVSTESVLVQLDEQATAGLPAPTSSVAFLSGGTKGATTDASIQAALNRMALTRGNFVVPLFSRDATSDIADALTEATSTYTIAAVHSYARAHVLSMSTLKKRRHRQAFLSIRDTFENAQTVSANLASSRCIVTFQDIKDTGANGVQQFQPWMGAVKAASMQAAGFYRAIFNKGIAISGALQAAGDFDDQDEDQIEDALKAGLLIVRKGEDGGFTFVSDQTTYGKDSNFVYNSIQATYAADTVALSTSQRMEKAFVGQSPADVTPGLAMQTLEAILDDMVRLKLIAPSDDAPKGYKNANIKMGGAAMVVNVEIKVAGAIYFIPINFLVSQVSRSS